MVSISYEEFAAPRMLLLRRPSAAGYASSMNTPNTDPKTAAEMHDEPDFADEHTKLTHADEHPTGEELETDESTPREHG